MSQPVDHQPKHPSRVGEVARLFLRLGFTAFGGPAAHVALMEQEVVNRLGWLDRRHFLDMVSAVNFIPGPNSTELAIHVGYVRAGWAGLVVAGVCFITPAMLIVLPLAWLYVAHGHTPGVKDALTGIKACMVAIVAVALWRFAKTGLRDPFTTTTAIFAIVVSAMLQWYGVPQQELIVLGAAAVAGLWWYGGGAKSDGPPPADTSKSALPFIPIVPLAVGAASFSGQVLAMALFFLKVGATLFGSGYVLASFLHGGLVEQHRWLSERELLDAIAVGQVTPGPLLTAATFIGYVLGSRNFGGGVAGGLLAGVVATAAIFLPSFVFVCVLGPILPRLRQSPRARGALDGMNAAVVALILLVTVWFAQSILWRADHRVDALSLIVFCASLALLLWTRLNATWLILGSGIVGVGAKLLG